MTATRAGLIVAALVLALLLLPDAPAADRLTSRPPSAVTPADTVRIGDELRTTDAGRRVRLADGTVLLLNRNTTAKLDAADRLTLSAGEVLIEQMAKPFAVQADGREVRGSASFAVRTAKDGPAVVVARGKVEVTGIDNPVSAGQRLAPGSKRAEPAPRLSHLLEWTREPLAAASPLVPGSKHSGGSLVVVDPDGQEAKLSLRKYHIDVHIEDGFARTTIDQTFFNHENRRLEGTFYFPLPPDASLSRLAMYVDGNLMEGGMAERDYARAVYETILYAQKDPALLEWVDGSTFKMRVFPLEPRQEKRLLLSCTQRLPSLYGRTSYRFPAGHSLDAVREWGWHARIKNGVKTEWASDSHTLKASKDGEDLLLDATARNAKLDRDVVLHLSEDAKESIRFSTAVHEGAKYLMLRYRPELASPERRQRRDWVFLFESSGDRDPLLGRAQIEVVRGLLSRAEPDDTFMVLTASTRTQTFEAQPRPVTAENAEAALAFLEKAHLVGALDLGRALEAAAPLLKAGKNPHLVHVGSGIAAMGEKRDNVLAQRIPERTRYVGVGVGKRWGRSFMKQAAEKTGGLFTQINPDEPIAWRTFELASTLDTPRALDLKVTDAAGRVAFLPFTSMVTQGEEFAAVARVPDGEKLPAEVVITGRVDDRPFEERVRVDTTRDKANHLPRTWASLEIERLLAEDAAKHKEKIVALSKAMYVMTPFTSLLVLENEDMYVQYKVDRGRKDHWASYPAPPIIPVVTEPDPDHPLGPAGKPSAEQVVRTVALRTDANSDAVRRNVLAFERIRANKEHWFVDSLELERHAQPMPPYGGFPSPRERRKVDLSDVDRIEDVSVPGVLNMAGNPVGTNGQLLRLDPDPSPRFLDREFPKPADVPPIASPTPLSDRPVAEPADLLERLGGAIQDQRTVRASMEQDVRFIAGTLSSRSGTLATHGKRLLSMGGHGRWVEEPEAPAQTHDEQLLYHRPDREVNDRLFFDLVGYAPGMEATTADLLAVIEAEAAPSPNSRPGRIDAGARRLIDGAREAGWQALTLPAPNEFTITFDGTGRFAWKRTLFAGLREEVVCDGKTLLHLYPDLGIGARRSVSRFHREDFSNLVPWAVPPADDLAHGADLTLVDEHTVAIVPHPPRKPRPGAKSYRIHLTFAADGRIVERRVIEGPAGQTVRREVYTADGTVKLLDGKGNQLAVRPGKLAPAQSPDLNPDTKKLVVLPLPYRTPDHIQTTLKIRNKAIGQLRFDEGLALFTAHFGTGNASAAEGVSREVFRSRNQSPIGFFVLLASIGGQLDAEHLDVQADHPDDPLAQYLTVYSSPVLRQHASEWAVSSAPKKEGFLYHLALTHALFQRWRSERVTKLKPEALRTERMRALNYIENHAGSAFAWGLLGLLQDRAGEDAEVYRQLAERWKLFEKTPGLAYSARYEQARCQLKGGRLATAQKLFRDLYEETLKEDVLPAIDGDFRTALLGDGKGPDGWSELLQSTAKRLIEQKHRPAVLTLAWQCWQLGDESRGNHLLGVALDGITDAKEHTGMTLAGVEWLSRTGQVTHADQMLQTLLDDKKEGKRPLLWRMASKLAEQRQQKGRELECLERALELEYGSLPEVINLRDVRQEYGRLMEHYRELAESMETLRVQPPAGFLAKVVRTVDRWRALDREGVEACRTAGRVLQVLGDRELAWDYLTTPVGLHPNESGPWLELGQSLARRGDLDLADRAYRAAFEAEPTNAQLLWDRGQNLKRAGKTAEARDVFRQLADGEWQPRFRWLKEQARSAAN